MASNWVSSLWNATTYSYNILRHKLVPGQDEFYLVVGPVVIYWVISLVYELLDRSNHPYVLKHRVARKDPGRGNPVGRGAVFRRVLLQQFIQTVLGCVVMVLDPEQCTNTPQPANLLHAAVQLVIGMVVMDAWQYWIHRGMHVNKFLYRHIHSTHHRLVLPYAFGALYNHPLEALLLDTLGAGISMYAAGMSCKLATAFFMFSTAKTVLDHCNYRFPLNPLHDIFPNSAGM
jgi:sphinganine C4-monooxygenase